MAKLIIQGGPKVNGEISVCGAKNAVLPILAAALLTEKTVKLTNCPNISDVTNMLCILQELGCRTNRAQDTITINTSEAASGIIPEKLSRKMRSSIFMLGPMLSRFRHVCCVYPGGCDIGNRPIDLHIKGLRDLNIDVQERDGHVYCDSSDIRAAVVHLDFPSVGATENIMMAATAADGVTTITNAACEPEIVDLQNFMRELGYEVLGAGTSTITVIGKKQRPQLKADVIEHRIIPDRIVTGTLLCSAAITNGNVVLHDVNPSDSTAVISKLREMGCRIETTQNTISLDANTELKSVGKIETMPHPGFPTDMQALIFAVCTVCKGTSVIVESLFENRYRHASELAKMGANAIINDRMAVITGGKLHGAHVEACDLRGGAALVVAGLAAEGTTVVERVDEHIDRGYDHLENLLNALGANIIRAEV